MALITKGSNRLRVGVPFEYLFNYRGYDGNYDTMSSMDAWAPYRDGLDYLRYGARGWGWPKVRITLDEWVKVSSAIFWASDMLQAVDLSGYYGRRNLEEYWIDFNVGSERYYYKYPEIGGMPQNITVSWRDKMVPLNIVPMIIEKVDNDEPSYSSGIVMLHSKSPSESFRASLDAVVAAQSRGEPRVAPRYRPMLFEPESLIEWVEKVEDRFITCP